MALLPLADEEAGRLLASIPEEKRNECWWLVQRDGTLWAGNEGGGVRLLAEMALTRPLATVLRVLRLSRFIDFLDGRLTTGRKRLGKFVPEGPAPRRYP